MRHAPIAVFDLARSFGKSDSRVASRVTVELLRRLPTRLPPTPDGIMSTLTGQPPGADGPSSSATGAWATLSEAIRGSNIDYTTAPIGRAVIMLAVPMVMEMAMESIFAVADVFWVAHLGADA